jgi:hypothetical protein
MIGLSCIARLNFFLCRFAPPETYIDTVISGGLSFRRQAVLSLR